MLIFSVSGSGAYQGIARLLGGPLSNMSDTTNSLACPVEWLSRADISFNEVRYVCHSTNVFVSITIYYDDFPDIYLLRLAWTGTN